MQSSPPRRKRVPRLIWLLLLIAFIVPIGASAGRLASGGEPRSFGFPDWGNMGTLPPAAKYSPARIVVLAAPTRGWRSAVAVHSWIVFKPEGAREWTRYDVVGWGGNPVRLNGWAPDAPWLGRSPYLISDITGEQAEKLIPKIQSAVKEYRWRNAGDYRAWPGPNSNTFVANVLRSVPELGVLLPPNAIGRDYRPDFYAGMTDSGTGIEINFWGYLGLKLGWIEGVELNVLGFVAGFDLRHPAIKLPGFGRIGLDGFAASANAKAD
jgi:hypothetical protein